MLKMYGNSVCKALQDVYRDHKWLPWKFQDRVPLGTWNDTQMERDFLAHFAKEMDIKQIDDWYHVTVTQICEKRGAGLLANYQSSPSKMITSILSEHNWDLSKFTIKTKVRQDDIDQQRQFIDQLGKVLNITHMEDWYNVSAKQIIKNGLGWLLQKYNGSPMKLITSIMKEHSWDLFKFSRKPRGTWNDMESQRKFLNLLAQKFKIQKMEDWYHIGIDQINSQGGNGLLQKYDDSPSKMITTIIPEHHWNMYKFGKNEKGRWDDVRSQREMVDYLSKELNITRMEDWYLITAAQIREKGGAGLLGKYNGSPSKMITSVLTEQNWDLKRFSRWSRYSNKTKTLPVS
eukprot:TRINITY_DN6819_c0_g1_i1.p1 TRINITY_DN6819_c0_g1~~TRINITY_DN6819_c0_g1_i1.p1  ORF type:complete len:345 (+),score=60.30 TRINITY_DN6819_c0_g1_i1:359-1393(+)